MSKQIIKKHFSNLIGSKSVIRIKEKKLFTVHPEYKELLRSNIQFKNLHKNKRCFIIGNGPSIANFDFSILKDEYTFSVNQLSRRADFTKLNTNYHCWIDTRFFNIDSSLPEDLELLDTMKRVNTHENKPVVFYSLDAYPMIKRYKLDEELDIHYIGVDTMPKESALKNGIDFSRITLSFPTVVQTTICLAVYMGFKDIYLIGCDCTGFMSIAQTYINSITQETYGYNLTDNEKKRMIKSSKLTSIRDELKWYVDLFDAYDDLNSYCNNNGVNLYNATEGGLLNSLLRVDINKVIKGNE